MSLLVWGANPSRAFPGDDCISHPTEVQLPNEGDELIWMGWASAIARKEDGSLYALTAAGPRILTDGNQKAHRVIGGDSALAYLDTDGFLRSLPAITPSYDAISQSPPSRDTSISQWADVAASETAIMGLAPDGRLFVFPSLDAVFTFSPSTSSHAESELHWNIEEIRLPPLPAATFRLYALETRLFVHVAGEGMHQLLELVRGEDDLGLGQVEGENGHDHAKGKGEYPRDADMSVADSANTGCADDQPSTRLIAIDIDALSFTVIPGAKNRLGILCDTGGAYLLDSRSREVELLELGGKGPSPDVTDDVRHGAISADMKALPTRSGERIEESGVQSSSDEESDDQDEILALGVGAGFEVLVCESGVWVRGDNNFGQLGNGSISDEPVDTFVRMPIDVGRVSSVTCSRWTTALVLSPADLHT